MNDEQPTQSQEVENAATGMSLNGAAGAPGDAPQTVDASGIADTGAGAGAGAEAMEAGMGGAGEAGTADVTDASDAIDAAEPTGEAEAGTAGAMDVDTPLAASAADTTATMGAAGAETEARDDQDAQMPGETDIVGANEAEPQIMEAARTSQAEGELEATADLPGADTVDTVDIADLAETPEPAVGIDTAQATDAATTASPADTGDMGDVVGAGTGGAGSEEASEEMVIRTARDPRLDEMAPNASMEDLLKASEQQYRTLKHGDVIEGSIMKLGREEILVDIGAKTEGIIPAHELQSLSQEERDAMQIGDSVLVSVVQPENNEGHSVLSLDRARQERSWRDLQKQFEAGEVIQAKVSGHNKGGLLVNLEGVRGFVPSSQISSMPPGEANKQAEMAKMQNQTLPLKIIEINRNRNRLILSERQAVQEQRESTRTRLLRELEPGQIRPGTVSSICDFGAFVDIGGADGLIHLSELSWKRVSHPSEVLHVGDHINVYVLSVDPNERKIALSLKRTQPEPWTTITENYHLGQLVRGTITQLTTFGAFARLEDGIEGLIHVSELAEGRVAHPKNVVKEGDVLELKVIRIDPAKRRIGLSLKRVNEDAEGAGTGTGEEGAQQAEGRKDGGRRPA